MLLLCLILHLYTVVASNVIHVAVFFDSSAVNMFFNQISPAAEIKNMVRMCLYEASDILKQVDTCLILTNHISEFPWKHAGIYDSVEDYTRMMDESLSVHEIGLDHLKSQTSIFLMFSGNDIFSTGRIHADKCGEQEFTKIVLGIRRFRNELQAPEEIVHSAVVGLLISMGMNDSCIVPDSLLLADCARSLPCRCRADVEADYIEKSESSECELLFISEVLLVAVIACLFTCCLFYKWLTGRSVTDQNVRCVGYKVSEI